ncbi:MAG: DUF4276 family protein [Desulfobacteraceae bacterium]|nr:DUF4276 family protein [Desulfobacteraceae bacterium]
MTDIIVVGEDDVTREIIKRLLQSYRKDFDVIREEPVRGGKIKKDVLKYNCLNLPVIMLTDLDQYDCPPSLIREWFQEEPKNPNLVFRVACDEAEGWLMADKTGFAKFLKISEDLLPALKSLDTRRNPQNIELAFPYKPSLFLMRELAQKSADKSLKEKLMPRTVAKKGSQYNSTLLPFVVNHWNIEAAIKNSYSLQKAVERIIKFKSE